MAAAAQASCLAYQGEELSLTLPKRMYLRAWIPSSVCAVEMVLAEFWDGVVSTCWTAKQPPKGPARALLRHRMVQILPVEPVKRVSQLEWKGVRIDIPPVQARSVGIVTVMLKSSVLACEKPLAPGTLLVTERLVWPVTPRELPVVLLAIQFCDFIAGIELTRWIHVTNVRSSSISVDLVESDSYLSACLDLGDSSSSKLVLSIFSNINVASQLCSSTFVDNIG